MDKGWICLHRKIRECNIIWDDKPFSRGQAWLDLLLQANHEDKEILFNGSFRKIERGQTLTSLTKLSEQWGWSRKKTTKFLNELKTAQMLHLKSDNKSTTITIVNYGFYQDMGTTEEPKKNRKRTSEEHQRNTNNNYNNKKEKDIMSASVEEVISYLNEKAGKKYSPDSKATCEHIKARLDEGHTVEECKRVIDVKCAAWLNDSKMNAFLRPKTLFAPSHFEDYLNEAPAPKPIPIALPEPEEEEMTDEEFKALVESNFGEVG